MANIIRSGTSTLWRPDLYKIFPIVAVSQTPIKLFTRLDAENLGVVNMELSGLITNVNGQECRVLINESRVEFNVSYPEHPVCEYSMTLASRHMGNNAYTEYMGSARILKSLDVKNGVPGELLLHFSLPSRSRPMRRHDRKSCAHWRDIVPGLALLDSQLRSRQQLLSFFRHYFRKRDRHSPALINISPGGVCLRTEDVIARRLMSSQDRYLFFFFLKSPGEEKIPWVFLGRKAGIFRIPDSAATGLRIHFLNELQWQGGNPELQWQDISGTGSEKLRRALAGMPREDEGANASPESEPGEIRATETETGDKENQEEDLPPEMPFEP